MNTPDSKSEFSPDERNADLFNEIAQNILAVDDASSDLLNKSQSMSTIAHEVGHDSVELNSQMKSFQV